MIIKFENKKVSNLHRFFAFEAKGDEEKEDKKKYTVVKAEGDNEATDYTDNEDDTTEEPSEDNSEEDVEATDYTDDGEDDEDNSEYNKDDNEATDYSDDEDAEEDSGELQEEPDEEETDNQSDDTGEAEATDYTDDGEAEGGEEGNGEDQEESEAEEQNPEAEDESYRKYDLFKDFINLKNTLNSYISTLGEMVGDNIEANIVITTVVNNLKDLSKMIHEFMLVKYDNTSYFQAMIFYKSCTTMIELNFDLLKNNKPYLKQ